MIKKQTEKYRHVMNKIEQFFYEIIQKNKLFDWYEKKFSTLDSFIYLFLGLIITMYLIFIKKIYIIGFLFFIVSIPVMFFLYMFIKYYNENENN